MSDRACVDQNVSLCAHDVEAEAKHPTARVFSVTFESVDRVRRLPVLQAFYVNVTRKMAQPISRGDTRGRI